MTEPEAIHHIGRKPMATIALSGCWHDGLVDFVMRRDRMPTLVEFAALREIAQRQAATPDRTARRERLRLEMEVRE